MKICRYNFILIWLDILNIYGKPNKIKNYLGFERFSYGKTKAINV